MRHLMMTMTVLMVFTFGMSASMAQTRQGPSEICVNSPQIQA
jgi:hypothetical protein